MTNREYMTSLDNKALAKFLICYNWLLKEEVPDKELTWDDLDLMESFEDWLKEEHKE